MNKLQESCGSSVYYQIIGDFFSGSDEKLPTGQSDKGHLWICKHGSFDTLTWEPWDSEQMQHTGQYEIAVRILIESIDGTCKYPGYVAEDGCLFGQGTAGH